MPRMWMWGVTTKDVSVGLQARELNSNRGWEENKVEDRRRASNEHQNVPQATIIECRREYLSASKPAERAPNRAPSSRTAARNWASQNQI